MGLNGSSSVHAISVFGLGKLGAVMAGCYASRGFRVIGVDINQQNVDSCNRGVPPIQEPGLEDLYRSCRGLLEATVDGVAAVRSSDTTLITVPTPSDADGGYSLEYVLEACNTIGRAIRDKNAYHLVVLKSTVLPGACNGAILPRLEAQSGKRCGVGFGFCYNPEFIALGSVIHNIFNPDLILIGESSDADGDRLLNIFARLMTIRRPTARMNLVNSEVAKLAVNSYVTMKITFANLLARLCEQLPGGDVDTVTAALGLDGRIGPKYLKGGLGYGGPCFPRDNEAMLCLARRLGVSFPLASATDEANREIAGYVANVVASTVAAEARIGILGLSYKPNTPVIDESQGILIAQILLDRGFDILAYDPVAMDAVRNVFGDRMEYAPSAQNCVLDADAILIATPWEEFKQVEYAPLNGSKSPVVIDCWGILEERTARSARVLRLGKDLSLKLNDQTFFQELQLRTGWNNELER